MKKELLSPAGSLEALYQAVNNGADAVYISGKNYGARKFATNFSIEETETAVKYCHLYEVKLYVTVNTLIYDREIDDVINYIRKLHILGVDAIIMQDLGLIKLVHDKFPNLEIHASTQMHNHNEEGINALKDLGVTRVVLARELSLGEINNIKTSLEKEVFIHGALCISYSGECLFSSVILNRSGNRGECAGFCRLPYELYCENKKIDTKGKYLLSPKELCSINDLKQILKSDIKSLKIEGRMKSPEYVGFITKLYRTLIDKYKNNEDLTITDEEYKNLKKLFNREFTKGFLNNESNKKLMNIKSPNHQGVKIGKVLSVNKNKIKIELSDALNKEDGLRFSNNKGMIANFIYNDKNMLIKSAKKNDIIYLDNKINLTEKGIVLKTTDIELLNKLKNYTPKKLNISFLVEAKKQKEIKISIKYKNNVITYKGNVIESSKNRPTTIDDIKEKLRKTGNTPFHVENMDIIIDENIFIPVKELNDIRRILCKKLKEALENTKKEFIEKEEQKLTKNVNKTTRVSFLVRKEEQIKALINKNVDIYIEDITLYNKYKQKNVYYRTPRVDILKNKFDNENLVVSTLGAIKNYNNNNNLTSDIYLNVVNKETIKYLTSLEVNKIGLSPELKDDDLDYLMKKGAKNYNLEIMIYGKIELMIMKYCILNDHLNKGIKCSICKNNNRYYLKDRNNAYYNLHHVGCTTYLLNYNNINNIEKIEKYKNIGITNYRIDLFDESAKETSNLYEKIAKIL